MASRSLGTLTLDLVAKIGGFTEGLSKAERRSEKWRRKMEKDAKMVAKSLLAVGTAVAAGTTALVVSTARQAKELQNLSIVANSSVQDLQKLGYAAAAYGVEQEKVADILKDTNDKIGDFIQTGGGPLVDFFENIAPLVGVTAEEFRNLSGDEALGLYVSSLEKANLSQSDMIFYMEAIASDASALIPLFKDNAKELKEFGKRADELGLIFSDQDIKNAEEFNKKIRLIKWEFEAVSRKIALELLPHVEDFLEILTDPEVLKNLQKVGEAIIKTFGKAAEVLSYIGGLLEFIGEEAAVATVGINPQDLVRLEADARKMRRILAGVADFSERLDFEIDGFIGTGWNIISDEEALKQLAVLDAAILKERARLEVARQIAQSKRDAAKSDGKGGTTDNRPNASFVNTEARAEFKSLVESLRTQEEAIFESYDKRRDIILKSTKANSEAQTQLLKRLDEQYIQEISGTKFIEIQRSFETEEELLRRQLEDNKNIVMESTLATETGKQELIKQLNERFSEELKQTEVGQLIESLKTEEEQIAESYERRRDLILQSTELSVTETQEALARLQEERDRELSETAFGRLQEQLQTEEERIAQSYEDRKQIILDSTQATEEEKTEMMLRLEQDRQAQLAEIEMARLENAEKLFGALSGLAKDYAGESSGIYRALFAVEKAAAVARSIVSINAAIAQAAASGPFPTNLAAMATVAAETASIVSTIMSTQIKGVAHDGLDSVPTTGTYLLEKGERVTTEKTSMKLDRKLDRIESSEMSQPDVNIKMNNIIDPQFVGDYMGGDQGDAIIDNWVTRNQTKIQRVAGQR